ncbi:MAG: hypothetical protein R3C14_45925 [Caldilineaceae bacterium]
MTTLSPVQSLSKLNLGWQPHFVQRLLKTNRWIVWNLVFYCIAFIATLVLAVVDTRLVTGAPVWIKPLKFAISSILYLGTLLWILSYVEGRRRLVNIVLVATAIGFGVELVAIWLQAGRGVRSHFNVSTAFDATLFSMMGAFVLVIWAMNILAALLLLWQRMPDRTLAWALRLGLLITIVGGSIGALMTQPTPDQLATMQAGHAPTFVGAHSIGVEDGGPGLPFTGWSTEGGDLRVGHFFGLHALQILPLLGILINRRWGRRLAERRRVALIWIGGLGYLGLTGLLTWQALRGQPLIAPDALTLTTMAGLIAAVLVSSWLTIRLPQPGIGQES